MICMHRGNNQRIWMTLVFQVDRGDEIVSNSRAAGHHR